MASVPASLAFHGYASLVAAGTKSRGVPSSLGRGLTLSLHGGPTPALFPARPVTFPQAFTFVVDPESRSARITAAGELGVPRLLPQTAAVAVDEIAPLSSK